MPSYTVTEIVSNREFESKFGPMKSYKLNVEGDDGFSGTVEVAQKQETSAPTVGQAIEGTLDQSNPKYPPKLKKAQKAPGGAPKGKSKADQDSIERAVAYKGAVDLTCAIIAASGNTEGKSVCAAVDAYFHHGLTLLQGGLGEPAPNNSAPAPKVETKPTITHEQLVDAYKAWSMGKQATGVSGPEAQSEFELKKTALGIAEVNSATADQKEKLFAFLTEAV